MCQWRRPSVCPIYSKIKTLMETTTPETSTPPPASKARTSAGPLLARSESLEAKFGFKSLKFVSASRSSFSSMPSSVTGLFHRSASPTRVNKYATNRFRLSIDRSKKKTCMCSPTTHPGSFRCSIHKRVGKKGEGGGGGAPSSPPHSLNRLYERRSAMTNSLVRIGTVEGDLVKRALAALIQPSSHQKQRRSGFQPRPTRLSVMSTSVPRRI